jgi:flagellar hook-length control protein FliK
MLDGLVDDDAGPARFGSQVVRGLTAMINRHGGALTLRLDPPELGELRIQMTIARGAVTATFHAVRADAHALLEQTMGSLRAALEAHGLHVESLTTSGPASTHDASRPESDQDGGDDRRRDGHADDGAAGEHPRDDASRDQPSGDRRPVFTLEGVTG